MTARDVIVQALALSEGATAGPWEARETGGRGGGRVFEPSGHPLPGCFNCGENDAVYEAGDAAFIAAARTLLPAFAKALGDVLATVEAHGEWARFESADPGVDSWAIPTHLIQGAITAALSEVTP